MQELIPYPNWVVTYLHDKIPLNPYSGNHASVSDPLTWSDYATAKAVVDSNAGLCLGFVLTNAPFVCIDLDTYKTTDQQILSNHKEIFESFNTYAELSPNGGVHIWCKGSIPSGCKQSKQYIEMYPSARYITITGNALRTSPINDCQPQLNELYAAIHKSISPIITAPDDLPEISTDEQVIKQAANALNGELFKDLYLGKWQDKYPSQSEADQAFCNIVAFYSDNKKQVARIFLQCELGKRAKAKRRDYLYHEKYGIVTRAFDQKLPNVTFQNLENIVKAKVHEEALKFIQAPIIPSDPEILQRKIEKLPQFIKEGVDYDFDELPPGLVGEIAQFIFYNAVRPVKEISICGAISYLAGIVGRSYNISKTGLNHYIAVLAPTAGGKEGAASGMERLSGLLREKNPEIDQFMGPSDIASPQALLKHLSTVSPCFLSHKGEMGFWLQKLTAKFAKSNETTLRGMLLDLYTKSGKNQLLRGSIYSDKSKDVEPVQSPALSIFGDATPDTFYKALDEENIEEGLVSRFTIVECLGERTIYNESHGTIEPNQWMMERLSSLVRKAVTATATSLITDIQETPEAHSEHMKFMAECYEKVLEDRDSVEGKLYSRAHLKLLRLAGLIAVGCRPEGPVLEVEHVEWARKFIVHGIARVVLRFEQGEVGEVSYYLEQKKTIKELIKRYWLGGWKDGLQTKWGISREMFDGKVITNRYILAMTNGKSCFRRDRNPTLAYRNVMNEFCENGILLRLDMSKIRESGRTGIAYYITDLDAVCR